MRVIDITRSVGEQQYIKSWVSHSHHYPFYISLTLKMPSSSSPETLPIKKSFDPKHSYFPNLYQLPLPALQRNSTCYLTFTTQQNTHYPLLASYHVTLNSPFEPTCFTNASKNTKFNALIYNNKRKLVPKTPFMNVTRCKWICEIRVRGHSNLSHRHQRIAWIVAKGFGYT